MHRNPKDSCFSRAGRRAAPSMISFRSSLLGLTLLVVAHGALAADLLSVYREARDADAVYGSARASYLAGQEKLPQGLAGLLPAVTLSGSTLYNDRDLQFRGASPLPASRYNSNSLTLTA